jgi:hypothetical protein
MALESDRGSRRRGMMTACRGARRMVTIIRASKRHLRPDFPLRLVNLTTPQRATQAAPVVTSAGNAEQLTAHQGAPSSGRSSNRWGLRAAPYPGPLGLRPVGDHRLGGDQQPGNRCGVLQCHPHDLGRVDNPGRDHVLVFARLRFIAEIRLVLVRQPAHDDRAFHPGILRNLPDRPRSK